MTEYYPRRRTPKWRFSAGNQRSLRRPVTWMLTWGSACGGISSFSSVHAKMAWDKWGLCMARQYTGFTCSLLLPCVRGVAGFPCSW
ncbi:hypothetical protein ASPSYDRAFT_935345 [Aspergillus sydowii CBS 593.65]|uniref:Uncharacterized protein n=1 Tax=Aspergillus sydowii CBS 593.65 TaxID=1036612 RepID=A0A1L9TLE9_9EURO|nr:uncharacterized protein ASPSYDRAFT_935345 [Aspergillus sydowii CBS 593.65]OJJ60257.1 hypothetical protein ASPSYDRAFT_935345 [Aspergillus sydowii CBS 593.65]